MFSINDKKQLCFTPKGLEEVLRHDDPLEVEAVRDFIDMMEGFGYTHFRQQVLDQFRLEKAKRLN